MRSHRSRAPRSGVRRLAAALGLSLGCVLAGVESEGAGSEPDEGARVPLLAVEDAWKRLPAVESGGGGPLPSWARAMAGTLPYTTAAMLDLDRAYRESDSLAPKLAGAIRYVVARTVKSEYGRAYAAFDLRRAGLDDATIGRLDGDRSTLPEAERAALAFAERMTTAGDSSTDAEVAALVDAYGEAGVVAIVLQIAYANFMDRFVLALALPVEPGGPLRPSAVRFKPFLGTDVPAAPRPASSATATAQPAVNPHDSEWDRFNFEQVQERLEAQRGRKPRVSIPTWDEFLAALPEGLYDRAKPLRIRWSLLVSGRQPRLGPAWIKCLRTFENEAKQDRVFEESLFWVVTRTLRCFYCMGHCEMLLGVAGLDGEAVSARTSRLASDDWVGFPASEREAFAFARTLTRTPWAVDDAAIRRLVDQFGPVRALDVVWWSSRCQFMTKVSDAFQLPLERDNVFADFQAPEGDAK